MPHSRQPHTGQADLAGAGLRPGGGAVEGAQGREQRQEGAQARERAAPRMRETAPAGEKRFHGEWREGSADSGRNQPLAQTGRARAAMKTIKFEVLHRSNSKGM